MKADFPAHVFFRLLHGIQNKGFQPICIRSLGKICQRNSPRNFGKGAGAGPTTVQPARSA